MKKRTYGLVVLISLLVIVIILYSVIANATKKNGGGSGGNTQSGGIYMDRQPSEVEKVTYRTGGGEEFTIRRDESIYVLHEDTDFPLDTTAVGFITNAAARITYERRINPEGNDLAEYGLTDPQAVIDILYTDGARLVLTVGDYNAFSEAYYCTTGDGFVYLIGGQFSEAYIYKYADLIFHDHIEIPQYGFSSVTKVEILGGNKSVVYELIDSENELWKRNGESGQFAYEAMGLYNELFKLTLDEWVAYNVDTDEEFDAYGLKNPAIRVVFTHTELEEIEVDGGIATKEHTRHTAFLVGSPLASGEEGEGDSTHVEHYFAFGGGSIVYVVHEDDLPCTVGSLK